MIPIADLSQILSELLNSPDGMQKLQNAATSLGIAAPEPVPEPPAAGGLDLSAILGALGGTTTPGGNGAPPPREMLPDSGGGLAELGDLSMITKLMPLMSDFKKEDENTRLLHALRPYLQEPRRERLEQAVKILRLLKLLPLLKDSGGLF